MSVSVHVDISSKPDQSNFLRLVRWEDASKRERVSVQVRRADGVLEGEVDVSLDDLLSAVDALMARPR